MTMQTAQKLPENEMPSTAANATRFSAHHTRSGLQPPPQCGLWIFACAVRPTCGLKLMCARAFGTAQGYNI